MEGVEKMAQLILRSAHATAHIDSLKLSKSDLGSILPSKGYLDVDEIFAMAGDVTESQLFAIFKWLDLSHSGTITAQDLQTVACGHHTDHSFKDRNRSLPRFIAAFKHRLRLREQLASQYRFQDHTLTALYQFIAFNSCLTRSRLDQILSATTPEWNTSCSQELYSLFQHQNISLSLFLNTFRSNTKTPIVHQSLQQRHSSNPSFRQGLNTQHQQHTEIHLKGQSKLKTDIAQQEKRSMIQKQETDENNISQEQNLKYQKEQWKGTPLPTPKFNKSVSELRQELRRQSKQRQKIVEEVLCRSRGDSPAFVRTKADSKDKSRQEKEFKNGREYKNGGQKQSYCKQNVSYKQDLHNFKHNQRQPIKKTFKQCPHKFLTLSPTFSQLANRYQIIQAPSKQTPLLYQQFNMTKPQLNKFYQYPTVTKPQNLSLNQQFYLKQKVDERLRQHGKETQYPEMKKNKNYAENDEILERYQNRYKEKAYESTDFGSKQRNIILKQHLMSQKSHWDLQIDSLLQKYVHRSNLKEEVRLCHKHKNKIQRPITAIENKRLLLKDTYPQTLKYEPSQTFSNYSTLYSSNYPLKKKYPQLQKEYFSSALKNNKRNIEEEYQNGSYLKDKRQSLTRWSSTTGIIDKRNSMNRENIMKRAEEEATKKIQEIQRRAKAKVMQRTNGQKWLHC